MLSANKHHIIVLVLVVVVVLVVVAVVVQSYSKAERAQPSNPTTLQNNMSIHVRLYIQYIYINIYL